MPTYYNGAACKDFPKKLGYLHMAMALPCTHYSRVTAENYRDIARILAEKKLLRRGQDGPYLTEAELAPLVERAIGFYIAR